MSSVKIHALWIYFPWILFEEIEEKWIKEKQRQGENEEEVDDSKQMPLLAWATEIDFLFFSPIHILTALGDL